jgi:hypothetical protein
MALIISGFGRLLFLMMVIWHYDQLEFAWLISLFVLTSNSQALRVFLNEGRVKSVLIIGFGLIAKYAMSSILNRAVL